CAKHLAEYACHSHHQNELGDRLSHCPAIINACDNARVSKPVITVAVRELVEFSLRTGDLGSDRGFVGSRRALEGTRGHQRLQRSRPAGYQKEVRLAYDLVTEAFTLRIQGRIDGLWVTGSEVLLEEIKTLQ